jgi:hypothetical protein
VICRRIGEDGSLWFTSDSRSAKMSEIAAHRRAAVVCWLPDSREQYRFCGPVELVNDESLRQQFWDALTPETRAMFFWPEPGAPRSANSAFAPTANAPGPPGTFSLLSLRPVSVEHLMLSNYPHRRRRWTLATSWQREKLNP